MSWLSKQMGWDKQDKKVHSVVPFIEGGGILNVPGAMVNTIYNEYHNWLNPDRGDSGGGGTPPLKTQTAGQANNFGRFGDISQQAPGGWIRKQQKNRYGRASTILTRGTSRKAVQNRKTGY